MSEMLMMQLEVPKSIFAMNTDGVTHEESLRRPMESGHCMNWIGGHMVATCNAVLPSLGEDPVWDDACWARKVESSSALTTTARRQIMSATRVVPIYTCEDLEKTVAWYHDILGAEIGETFEHEGKLVGAEANYGAARIWLGQDDFQKGTDRQKGVGFRIILETEDDIDDLAEGIKQRGGELLMGPQDVDWGARMFAVADPDGFNITISKRTQPA